MPEAPPSRRRALTAVAAAAALLAAGAWSAAAQVGLPVGSTTTSTTAGGDSSTTTTAVPGIATTPTSAPSQQQRPPPAAPSEPLPAASDDGVEAPTSGFPPELQALTDSVARSGPSSTRRLVDALRPLVDLGLSAEEAAVVGFGRFPVAGEARWIHDWWFPRYGPGWRLHQGTDVFAARGTPVRAPVDGWVRIRNGGLGGLSVYVVQQDRTYFYLAHLAGLGPGIVDGLPVRTGQVVGYVGDSGNARGGPPHLHIEIHPGGGAAIDPKPILDRFVSDATARAPEVVAAYAGRRPAAAPATAAPTVDAPTPRLAALLPAPGLTERSSSRAALLWGSAVDPSAGTLRLAASEAARVAADVDWSSRVAAEQEAAFAQGMADLRARLVLAPLVPDAIAWAL